MKFSNFVRMHWAAFRALLVLTVITGLAYPLLIWLVAQLPGLHDKAEGSILTANGKQVGSRLIGQLFTDKDGNPLPQYFQSRPSAAGTGYDPTVVEREQPRAGEHRRHTRRPVTTDGRKVRVGCGIQAEPADTRCVRAAQRWASSRVWTDRVRSARAAVSVRCCR